jgi:hypothetical protein
MKSGVVYEGIFHTGMSDAKGMHAILKYARIVRDPNAKLDALAEKPKSVFVLDPQDLVQLVAKDVRMNAEDLAPGEEFETDAAISRGRGGCVGVLHLHGMVHGMVHWRHARTQHGPCM